MTRSTALSILVVFLVGIFAGCLGNDPTVSQANQEEAKKIAGQGVANAVFPGNYRFDGSYSYTIAAGPFAFSAQTPLGQGKLVTVPSTFMVQGQDVSPNAPGEGITMGIWFPDVPAGTKVPTIMDAGPYFGSGDPPVDKPANRLGKFLIENYVPYGYAVAQLAVRGTGNSVGCMDLMGAGEQGDINTALNWIGTQEWSNGAIGMIGRSYDGSTPWQGAAQGNKYLKTIVPISGLSDFFDLMTHNGTSETRAPAAIHAIYFTESFASVGRSQANIATAAVCPEAYRGFATAVASTVTGFRTPEANDYYYVRDFQKLARQNQKWDGSVFMIHGLQDWNVEPHMGAPLTNDMEAQGYFVKQLWGQWGHSYPDRPGEHARIACGDLNDRWDWAEIMLHWFDHELKGLTSVDTGPAAQIMDSVTCRWHNEEHFPPHDATWTSFHLSAGNKLVPSGPQAGSVGLLPNPSGRTGCDQLRAANFCDSIEFTSAPFEKELIISGLPRVHVTVTPHTEAGSLAAYLYMVNDTNQAAPKLIGQTQMNLLYAAGGDNPQPVVPEMDLLMKMQLEPMDAVIPAGSKVMLRIWEVAYQDHLPGYPVPVSLKYGGSTKSVLELPLIERGPEAFFLPPQPSPDQKLNMNSGPGSE